MIVPMKKVSLIIMRDDKKKTLQTLRKLGVVHIEIAEGSGERLNELKAQIGTLEAGIYAVGEQAKRQTAREAAKTAEAVEVAHKILSIEEDIKRERNTIIACQTELARLEAWGDFDPHAIEGLAQRGVSLSLYELPRNEYKKLGDEVKTIVFKTTKNAVYCVVSKTDAEREKEALDALELFRVDLPDRSTAAIRQQIEDAKVRIRASEDRLLELAVYTDSMKAAITALNREVEFETYESGMEDENLSERSDGTSIAYFRGFIPTEDLEKLKVTAKENAWGLLAEDPTEEDNAPTKLKNNKFVSLIYPLTDFLGTVPGYFEYDISGWFLGFILIFFGIIFGDGGYGLLISAIAAIPIITSLGKRKPIPPAFLLVGLFGLSTILWGMLTCTWFGLPVDQIPTWLQNISVPFISNVHAELGTVWHLPWTSGDVGLNTGHNLQIFCFTLALVQLSVAHVMGAVRNRRSLKILGDIGSLLQLFGIYYVVLSLVVNSEVFPLGLTIGGVPVGLIAIAMVGVGFVMNFVFANYEGSIVKSTLASLKNIVSVLLGVVNVFSDIVSYIRLWAVGLAGAAISTTVNQLASPLLGSFLLAVFAIFILVFGHGLNIILNVLSIIVHGIRLNTLEFSSHLGMSWSGHKYKPFEE